MYEKKTKKFRSPFSEKGPYIYVKYIREFFHRDVVTPTRTVNAVFSVQTF